MADTTQAIFYIASTIHFFICDINDTFSNFEYSWISISKMTHQNEISQKIIYIVNFVRIQSYFFQT